MRSILVLIILLAASRAEGAESPYLGVPAAELADVLKAKTSLVSSATWVAEPCLPEHVLCRWASPQGVKFNISTAGQIDRAAPRGSQNIAYQVEAIWTARDSATIAESRRVFQATCLAIIQTLLPKLSDARLATLLDKITFARRPPGYSDSAEETFGRVLIYGSANRPDGPSYSRELLLQCGAVFYASP